MTVSTYPRSATCDSVDFAELYAHLRARLERIVRAGVVIEDACQTAWSRLLAHREGVRHEAALSWLATTAVREAVKLVARERREASLDATLERFGDAGLLSPSAPPDELLERRQRLASVAELPERQQRLVWLHAVGLSYTEIAALTGDTKRMVERQLLQAKRRARELDRGA
jgi:RNA polymerase sigma factor (sigma-70 family)